MFYNLYVTFLYILVAQDRDIRGLGSGKNVDFVLKCLDFVSNV